MKQLPRQPGFTIVELLIVIVVIAILATISFVSYSNIQPRAKDAKVKANAATVKKVAEAYYSKNNTYPTADSHFRSGTITLPADVKLYSSANPSIDATTGENLVAYKYVGTPSNATGACIYYFTYVPSTESGTWPGKDQDRSKPELLGNATIPSCSASSGNIISSP